MAETIKSVLFIDYDSIHLSLSANDPTAAERLALRANAWIGAIEAGSLFSTKPEAAAKHRILVRRCYADPFLLGDARSIFLSNGFQIVDCPPSEGRERNAAATHMVLDTIDALEHPTNYEEFILLSVEADLSPVLIRLRAHNRTTAIYANAETAESYKAIADATVEESRLMSILLSEDTPTVSDEPVMAAPPADRSDVESLARKINAATNVPLLAPRTFAELFRSLVDEIAENGYHFQTTAENVATRMTASGRDATRRQVVFVVKGLALKGHVFSTDDTPERLAEVFREQVLYLVENVGIELDEQERSVLASWIIGHVAPASEAGAASEDKSDSADAKAETDDTAASPPAKPTSSKASRASKRRQSASTQSAKSETSTPAQSKSTRTAQSSESDKSKPAAKRAEKPTPAPAKSANDAEAMPAQATAAPSEAAAAQSISKTAPTRSTPDRAEAAVESSILAAIAEAVDVYVEEDDAGPKGQPTSAPPEAAPRDKEPPTAVAPEGSEEEEDEIGDEIQRILATYDRDRDQDSKN